jgi:hypothetical protein
MKLVFLFCFVLFFFAHSQYLDPGVQIQVLNAPYLNALQPCFTWNSLFNGPTIDEVAQYCPGEVYFACTSAVDANYFSIVAHGPETDNLLLGVNQTAISPNGAPFFRSASTIGIGSNIYIDNCTYANDSQTLCWNINQTNNQILPGGWCGAEGFQNQNSVFFGIFSLPCLNSTVGTNCTMPGLGLCWQNGTCLANYTCGNGAVTPAPVPLSDSCWTAPECDPLTGIYAIVNSSSSAFCSTNNSCLQNMHCDGMQNCIGGFSPCNSTTNTCLNQPICISYNASYFECNYVPNNNSCRYDDAWRCRVNDTCVGGTCMPGIPVPLPTLDVCQINATCNNITGGFNYFTVADNTTCVNVFNLCQQGLCSGGVCGSFTDAPSPLGNISACLVPVCSPNNGSWSTAPAGDPGAPCDLNDNCRRGQCLTNGTCKDFGARTCPFYSTAPCINSTCIPGTGPGTGCQNITLTGTSCNSDACNLNGTCSFGVCLNTTPRNCSGTHLPNPACMFETCNPIIGCTQGFYGNNVTCYYACYVNNTGFCDSGNCFGTPSGVCGSMASMLTAHDWWSWII